MACLVGRVADGDGFGLVWFGSVRFEEWILLMEWDNG